MFSVTERPTGEQLEDFRKSLGLPGTVTEQRKILADSIGVPVDTYKQYVLETRGAQMPAPSWTLLRITWDALLLAQWQQQHRRRGRI